MAAAESPQVSTCGRAGPRYVCWDCRLSPLSCRVACRAACRLAGNRDGESGGNPSAVTNLDAMRLNRLQGRPGRRPEIGWPQVMCNAAYTGLAAGQARLRASPVSKSGPRELVTRWGRSAARQKKSRRPAPASRRETTELGGRCAKLQRD